MYGHEDHDGSMGGYPPPHDELSRLAEHRPKIDGGKSLKSGEDGVPQPSGVASTAGGSKEGGSLHAVSSSFSNERGEGKKTVVVAAGVGSKGALTAAKSPGIVTHGSGSVGSTVDKGELDLWLLCLRNSLLCCAYRYIYMPCHGHFNS